MKLNDNKRIQLLWEEILAQHPSKHPQVSLQDQAKQLLLEYTEELTQSLIEAASAIAESKGSRQIDESDIALLLVKKLGVEVAGHEVTQPLHHYNLKSSIYSTNTEKGDVGDAKRGIKRKHGG